MGGLGRVQVTPTLVQWVLESGSGVGLKKKTMFPDRLLVAPPRRAVEGEPCESGRGGRHPQKIRVLHGDTEMLILHHFG